MIPDYLTFTRYQDKRVIIYLYLLTMFLLFLFWKNNGYNLLPSNVLSLSVNCLFFYLRAEKLLGL